jgi:ribose transport system substrate-binding protein
MKKFLLSALLLSSVATLAFAGGHAKKTFALVPKAMNNPFFDLARDGCKKAEGELAGIECLYIGPGEHTEQEQIQIVQDLIARKVDGIAVAPSNAPAMARVLKRAKDAGIPVITWDSDVLAEDKGMRAAYVGTKNYDIGVNLARLTRNLKPEGGTICIQSGGASAANHNERMQGIRDTLSGVSSSSPPGERLTGQNGWNEPDGCPLYTNDDFPLSVQQMADIFIKYPDLTAFVPTGGFPHFVPTAFRNTAAKHEQRIRTKKTAVVVADTLPMQMEILKDGLSHGLVGQQPYMMGYKAMYVLQDLVDGKAVEDPIYTGLDVCPFESAWSCLSGGG